MQVNSVIHNRLTRIKNFTTNVSQIVLRDFLRIIKAPAALVVVLVILILPSIYTWYNVAGFWNPYNNTGHIDVTVVNEDSGASADLTGEINVGNMIVEELQKNDQLKWQFTNREEAFSRLNEGKTYAIFILENDFSANLLTLLDKEVTTPKIKYYLNEKLGPISPKITDTGAKTLDGTINAKFTGTVANVIVNTFNKFDEGFRESAKGAKSKIEENINELLTEINFTKAELISVKQDIENSPNVAGAIDNKTSQLKDKLEQVKSTLSQDTEIDKLLIKKIDNELLLISQINIMTSNIVPVLDSTIQILSTFSNELTDISSAISTLKDNLENLLNEAGSNGEIHLNAEKISSFIESPTQLKTEKFYETDIYGKSMAPLFMNLTFWIGAFMLVIMIKTNPDGEGIKNITTSQGYFSRFVMFALISAIQAMICCSGLIFMGIIPDNYVAFYCGSILAAVTYTSIILALSATFQHVGKGICLLIVFAQIPAATGLYPVEMINPVLAQVYEFLPFTYGINIIREAMCGIYGDHFVYLSLVLWLFLIGFLVIGMYLRTRFASKANTFTRLVEESEIFTGGHKLEELGK